MKNKSKENIPNLYLKGYKHDNRLSLKTFVYRFLTSYNRKYDTGIPGSTGIQCYRGSYRSLGDITGICCQYYPGTTMAQVKEILLSFNEKLVGHYCGGTHIRVYEHKEVQPSWAQLSMNYLDEFGDRITYRDKNGKERKI